MAPDFKSYLAKQVIAEQNTVSYRNVSRALKVHVNSAKCMLYDFYEKENKKKPGSIYATYLISGSKRNIKNSSKDTTHSANEENLPSSPPPFSSSMLELSQQSNKEGVIEVEPKIIITLVREEALKDIRKQYDNITSIHLYSISPGRLPDVVALTDIGRELFASSLTNGDTPQDSKIYGTIQNPYVRRRKGKRNLPPDAPAPKFQPVKNERQETAIKQEQTVQEESRPTSRDATSTVQSSKPSLKRETSNLFKAFAKQKDKSKIVRQDGDKSPDAAASGAENALMKDVDDEGESEDDTLFPESKDNDRISKKRPTDVKKEREDRAAKLRRMMDSDDEANDNEDSAVNDEGVPKDSVPASTDGDENADEVEWSASDSEKEKKKPSEPRRRRGKRKVMKKRTFTDDGGFLVTQEEAVWESFSEDELESAKERIKPASSSTSKLKSQERVAPASSTPTEGGKKKGNIMSFFGKK